MYKHLKEHFYAAYFYDQTILLDLASDAYVVLTPDQSNVFRKISTGNLNNIKGLTVNEMEQYLLLFAPEEFVRPDPKINVRGTAYGGVNPNLWLLREIDLSGRKSVVGIFSALRVLHTVHCKSLSDRMHGLVRLKKESPMGGANRLHKDVQQMVAELNSACLFYPRATKCLEWACALALLHRQSGAESRVVVGVQNRPFYAHAWVEVDGRVIGDDKELRNQLAVILEF